MRVTSAELVGEAAQYEDKYKRCSMPSPRAPSSRWPSSTSEMVRAVGGTGERDLQNRLRANDHLWRTTTPWSFGIHTFRQSSVGRFVAQS